MQCIVAFEPRVYRSRKRPPSPELAAFGRSRMSLSRHACHHPVQGRGLVHTHRASPKADFPASGSVRRTVRRSAAAASSGAR